MQQKMLQVMFTVLMCASAHATILNSTNDFNYFDYAWYTGPEVRYSNSVPGIFESSINGVLVHASRSRGDGTIISKSAYTLAGGTAEYIWSGSGGSSFMQIGCGVITKPWPTDPNNTIQSILLTEYGNLYAGNWLGTPGRAYKTTITFTANSYALQTIDNLTSQIMATSSGSFDFTTPTYIYIGTGDTYDYLNAYLLLNSLTLNLLPTAITINQQPQSQTAQAGSSVTFSVVATGTPPLSFQWRKDGVNIAGATSPTLTLNSVGAANSGAYSVMVWNSYGSATSASAQLTVSQPLTLVQTNRSPTAAESAPPCPALPAQFKTFANGAFGSTGTISPAKQTIVLTHGWIPSVGPWALTQGIQGWPTGLAGALAAQGFGANANIVAWDWSSAAKSFPCNPGQAAGQTPAQGAALGQALLRALGPGYGQHIHFIGHSFGTLVNAGAANYLHANGYSWMNTEMTLFDEAEIGTDVGCPELFALALWSTPSSSQTCYQPLPLNCAWADNYVSLAGLLHPQAANVILSYGLPSAEFSMVGLIEDARSFHGYPCTWYNNTIPSPLSAAMGFRWSFEEGGFAAAPTVGTVYLQPSGGSQSDLVITDWTSASSLLSQRFQGYHAAAWLTGFADVSTLGTADGAVVGQAVWGEVASGVQATINLVTHSGGGSLAPSSGPHPLDATPGTNALACAWIPVTVPSNAVLMSFDFALQGDGQQDSFAAALNGTNILSLATSLIQTNVALNSGPIGMSQYAGQQVELFLGIVGGTSTNASVAVSNFRFYAMPAPALQAQVLGTSLVVSWPVWATDYSLEASSTVTGAGVWTPITNAPVIVDFQNTITNEISAGSRFYRLKSAH